MFSNSLYRSLWVAWMTLILAPPNLTSTTPATLYYVATTGSDVTGNGSRAHPWATIEHAIDAIPDGAEVWVADGTYGPLSTTREFARPTIVRAEHRYNAVLETDHRSAVQATGARHLVFQGLTIRRNSDAASPWPLVQLSTVSSIIFDDNVLRGSQSNELVRIDRGSDSVLFVGNLFMTDDLSTRWQLAISGSQEVTAKDNLFVMNLSADGGQDVTEENTGAIYIDATLEFPDSRALSISSNVFLNWQGTYLRVGSASAPVYAARELTVTNNVFVGNNSTSLRAAFMMAGATDVSITNNTLSGGLSSTSCVVDSTRGAAPRSQSASQTISGRWMACESFREMPRTQTLPYSGT